MTPYWGKLSGAMIGLASGRLWLVLVGIILGHQFDRGFARRSGAGRSRRRGGSREVPSGFVRELFSTMGYVAKADGRVSEEEIRAARIMMHRLELGPADIAQAIDWFRQGKQADFAPLQQGLRRLKRESGKDPELRLLFVRLLLEVGLSKPALHRRERAALWAVCSELDISRVELAQLEAMLRAQKGFRRSGAGTADGERLTTAYAVLGVNRSSSNDEIKKAYRRLMNRNHPDKLAGAAGDAALATAAAKRTREIRGAYEMLKARRSIR